MKPANERFKPGDIIRYASGVSALFRYDGTHNAGRLYGQHVLGGIGSGCDQNFFGLKAASDEDIAFCREKRPDWFDGAENLRDAFARSVRDAIADWHFAVSVELAANTSDCPVIRVDLGNLERYNITITRAR